MIDPGTKQEGETFDAYCQRRWGGSGWTNRLRSEGRKDGANFGDWKWWPNTFKAHQFMRLVKDRHDIDTSVSKRALFEALYEEGKNISLVPTLVDHVGGAKLGLSQEATQELGQLLDADQAKTEVMQEIRTGQQRFGIRGVPFFVIGATDSKQRPYGMSGAQNSATFLDLFQQVSDTDQDD